MTQRKIAEALAISGAFFALFCWIVIFFWPGYIFWVAWILIARGGERLRNRWFWGCSALWNLGVFVFLLCTMDLPSSWHDLLDRFGLWYAFIHSLLAVSLSIKDITLVDREGPEIATSEYSRGSFLD